MRRWLPGICAAFFAVLSSYAQTPDHSGLSKVRTVADQRGRPKGTDGTFSVVYQKRGEFLTYMSQFVILQIFSRVPTMPLRPFGIRNKIAFKFDLLCGGIFLAGFFLARRCMQRLLGKGHGLVPAALF
jgi:hypothetical protein